MDDNYPVFAVLGHPNEGKSSVVSTLAEDDSVKISPTPGETRVCRQYPVAIDGRTVICFVDTPGFQSPRKTLKWIEAYTGPDEQMISEFIRINRADEAFSDECELFSPLADGAGIIFVVDGSRPVRQTDSIEMEILRKTGLPRMIVINTKEKSATENIEKWKTEARKHFNTIRIFDAHRAGFAQRIDLLESLKHIDPDWQPALEYTIEAFKADWSSRIEETAAITTQLLQTVAAHREVKNSSETGRVEDVRKALAQAYQKKIAEFEKQAHRQIKKLFKHNIFSYELPPQSILAADLFDKKTWQVLGLTRRHLAVAGAGIGAGIGIQVDLSLAGTSLGVFTAAAALMGAGSAVAGTGKIASARIKGLPLGGVKIQIGPVENIQLLYILTDRCLIYFFHVISRAHSRRDTSGPGASDKTDIEGHLSAAWREENRKISRNFFKALLKNDTGEIKKTSASFQKMLAGILKDICSL